MKNDSVSQTNSLKQLQIVPDNRLSFEGHLKMILNKIDKTVGLSQKLHKL